MSLVCLLLHLPFKNRRKKLHWILKPPPCIKSCWFPQKTISREKPWPNWCHPGRDDKCWYQASSSSLPHSAGLKMDARQTKLQQVWSRCSLEITMKKMWISEQSNGDLIFCHCTRTTNSFHMRLWSCCVSFEFQILLWVGLLCRLFLIDTQFDSETWNENLSKKKRITGLMVCFPKLAHLQQDFHEQPELSRTENQLLLLYLSVNCAITLHTEDYYSKRHNHGFSNNVFLSWTLQHDHWTLFSSAWSSLNLTSSAWSFNLFSSAWALNLLTSSAWSLKNALQELGQFPNSWWWVHAIMCHQKLGFQLKIEVAIFGVGISIRSSNLSLHQGSDHS